MGRCRVMTPLRIEESRKLTFVSSNDVWGGSEELWSLTVMALARRGHRVSVLKPKIDMSQSRLKALADLGCPIADLHGPHWLPRKLRSAIMLFWPAARRMITLCLWFALRRQQPSLVVISQGLNYDGWQVAEACQTMDIPYVLISQKAADMYWPVDDMRDRLRNLYAGSRAAIFVSEHNRRLTEEQFGCSLPNAMVLRNPFHAEWALRDDWPDSTDGFQFACLARLDTREKGQDLLLRVLAMPKWRARRIRVRFFGSGHNRKGLEDMARYLGLESVSFAGFIERPETIWDDHHGLILPSHCEGLPLALVEAMLNARVAIVTDVGGAAEVLTDGETGFLAEAAALKHLDEAIERAWARRAEWREIGRAAAQHIRTLVPPDPAETLADTLLDLIDNPGVAMRQETAAG